MKLHRRLKSRAWTRCGAYKVPLYYCRPNCRGSACQTIRQPETSAASHNNRPVFSLPKLASYSSSSFSPSKQEQQHPFISSFNTFLQSLFAGAKLSTSSFDRTSLFYIPKFTQSAKTTRQESTFPAVQPSQNAIHTKNLKSEHKDEYKSNST